jgi:AcrR family transcriptional regulator
VRYKNLSIILTIKNFQSLRDFGSFFIVHETFFLSKRKRCCNIYTNNVRKDYKRIIGKQSGEDLSNYLESPKFKQIVSTAKELFYKFGIKRVSVEEICQTAQVSKMTFYKYFLNKIELAKYIFSELMKENEIQYDEIMASDANFAEKTDLVIKLKLDNMKSMSNDLIKEILVANPELQNLFHEKRQEIYEKVIKQYIDAQKNGDIRSDIKPEFILYLLNALTDFTKDANLINLYSDLTEMVKELTNFFFYGILARNNEQ